MKLLDEVEKFQRNLKAVLNGKPLRVTESFFVDAGAEELHQNFWLAKALLFEADHAGKTNFLDVELLYLQEDFLLNLVGLLLPFLGRVHLQSKAISTQVAHSVNLRLRTLSHGAQNSQIWMQGFDPFVFFVDSTFVVDDLRWLAALHECFSLIYLIIV